MTKSALQIARAAYQPKVPAALKGAVKAVDGEYTQSVADQEEIKKLFPNTYGMPIVTFEKSNEEKAMPVMNVGVILSGGQAPGGHNVIAGLFDGIKAHNADSRLYGFILGPGGLIDHKYMELTADIIDEYRNTGGFDMIGSGRTKLETKEQFDKGLQILKELDIKALVIIGGDDSNTNACVLAEYYKAIGAGVQVIGCPKTIDGDLKNAQIETSFGLRQLADDISTLLALLDHLELSIVLSQEVVQLGNQALHSRNELDQALRDQYRTEVVTLGGTLSHDTSHVSNDIVQRHILLLNLLGDDTNVRLSLQSALQSDMRSGATHQFDEVPVFLGGVTVTLDVTDYLGDRW